MDNKYIKVLEGISYPEWIRLKSGVDRMFNQQIGELEKILRLTNTEDVGIAIQSQFGQI